MASPRLSALVRTCLRITGPHLPPLTPVQPFRALHASSSRTAQRTHAATKPDPLEDIEQEQDEILEAEQSEREDQEDDDLFGTESEESIRPPTASPSRHEVSSAVSSDKSAQRAATRKTLTDFIEQAAATPSVRRNKVKAQTRVGLLRKVVQLTSEEEVEGLAKVLKGWRVLGKRVTAQTGEEIVGRCLRLNRPDIALQLTEDPTQYGIPGLDTRGLLRLHQSLLALDPPATRIPNIPLFVTVKHIVPNLALARLALLHRIDPDLTKLPPPPVTSSRATAVDRASGVSGILKAHLLFLLDHLGRPSSTAISESKDNKYRDATLERLKAAGGEWEIAGRRVVGAAEKLPNVPVVAIGSPSAGKGGNRRRSRGSGTNKKGRLAASNLTD